jgi:hypothetical protein
MSGRTAPLVHALEQQTAICRELVEALQHDRELVIRHDIPALERSNERKEGLVIRLQAAERVRQQETESLARTLGIAPLDARVSTLCPRLGSEADALERAAANLRAVVASLRDLVAIGHGFLEQSILGIRGVLGLIGSLRGTPVHQTYDASGRFQAGAAQAFALRREV